KALRARPENAGLLLIAVTGYGREEDRRRAKEAGFDHHLVKPVEPEILNRLLSRPQGSVMPGAERRLQRSARQVPRRPVLEHESDHALLRLAIRRSTEIARAGEEVRGRLRAHPDVWERTLLRKQWCQQMERFVGEVNRFHALVAFFRGSATTTRA